MVLVKKFKKYFNNRFEVLENHLEDIKKQNSELLWASYFRDSIASSNWVINKSFSAVNGAANYSLLYKILKVYEFVKPNNIIEFGLGQSTNLTRQYCAANPKAHAVVLDHDKQWVNAYSEMTKNINNLSLIVCDTEDFILPNGDIGAKDTQYEGLKQKLSKINKNNLFDFIIIDGPIGVDKRYSRTDILNLTDKLASTFVIIIDDSNRKGEQNTISLLRGMLEEKKIRYSDWTVNGIKQQTIFATVDIADVLWAL